jgi:hypothetical protein
MYFLMRVTQLVLLFVLALPAFVQASELETVLDRLIENYGGETNLRKLDNMVQEWDMVALMGNRHGTDTRSVRAPGHLRVELKYPDKSETRLLNGDAGYVIFQGTAARQVTGMQLDAMRLQLMRLYSPLMLRDKMDSMGLIEQGDLLALSLAENGVHVHYMVDKENWRIVKVAGSLMMNGNEIRFLTEYSDFSVVDGILMHHKENKFANGVNTAVLQLRKVASGIELEDSRFKP